MARQNCHVFDMADAGGKARVKPSSSVTRRAPRTHIGIRLHAEGMRVLVVVTTAPTALSLPLGEEPLDAVHGGDCRR